MNPGCQQTFGRRNPTHLGSGHIGTRGHQWHWGLESDGQQVHDAGPRQLQAANRPPGGTGPLAPPPHSLPFHFHQTQSRSGSHFPDFQAALLFHLRRQLKQPLAPARAVSLVARHADPIQHCAARTVGPGPKSPRRQVSRSGLVTTHHSSQSITSGKIDLFFQLEFNFSVNTRLIFFQIKFLLIFFRQRATRSFEYIYFYSFFSLKRNSSYKYIYFFFIFSSKRDSIFLIFYFFLYFFVATEFKTNC